MSAVSTADLRKRWIANTESLHRKGYFANYTPKQLAEVLKKGYLGRWPPTTIRDPGDFSAADVAQSLTLLRPDSSGRGGHGCPRHRGAT